MDSASVLGLGVSAPGMRGHRRLRGRAPGMDRNDVEAGCGATELGTAMPLQNRVTPFGEIVAIAQRGLFTGNRGIIHDPDTKTLLKRRWPSKPWPVCGGGYKGIRGRGMARRSWPGLFFLDEPVALAPGHRP